MMPYIIGVLIMGALLWFVLRPASPTIDSRSVEWEHWEDDCEEEATEPEPLYKVGQAVLLRFNRWWFKGYCEPEYHEVSHRTYQRMRDQQVEIRQEERFEVYARVIEGGLWNDKSRLYLIYFDGVIDVPLSVCDGSDVITYYTAPESNWIIRSDWAREWTGGAR